MAEGNKLDSLNLFLLSPTVSIYLGYAVFNQGHLAAYWGFPALMSFYCFLPIRKAMLANVFLLLVLCVAAVLSMPVELYARMISALISSSIFASIMVSAVERQHNMLQNRIVTDHLTGVFNRSLLEPTLESSISLLKSRVETRLWFNKSGQTRCPNLTSIPG